MKEAVSNRSDAFKTTYQQKFKEIVDKEPDDYYPDAWLVFVYQARPAGEDGLAFLNSGRLHCATAAVVTEGQSIKATTALEQVRSLGGASRITRRTIDNGELLGFLHRRPSLLGALLGLLLRSSTSSPS